MRAFYPSLRTHGFLWFFPHQSTKLEVKVEGIMPKISAWTQQQSDARKGALEDAEASLRIEGLDPAADPRYQTIRAKLIAGGMSVEEAQTAIDSLFGVNRKALLV